MSSKDDKRRLGGKRKSTILSGSPEQLSSYWQTPIGEGAEPLWVLRADLDRALKHYNRGELGEAAVTLNKVMGALKHKTKSARIDDSERVKSFLLYAAAHVLRGQIREQRGDEEAPADFQRAVGMYRDWLPK